MTEPLLQTKLFVPLARPHAVARPHLLARLDRGLTGRMTLVSAAAGYGKTTLVAAWVRHLDRPAGWLALDEGDNDRGRFLAYVGAALRRHGVAWRPLDEPRPVTLVNALVAAPSPVVLVLDDYHLVTAADVHDVVAFLLESAPPTFHLVIVSLTDPPLPLARLYARGAVSEVRTLDLLFTPAESAAFLNQLHDLALTAADVSALAARTEGWATGLQLAALSLRRLTPAERQSFTATFAGDDRYVLDYLIGEVLRQQTPARRAFLLRTACLRELSADLCAAVTGLPAAAAQEMLERLEQDNLFVVPLDNRRRWYRYHHLFADALRGRLEATQAEAATDVHRRAGLWYAARGRLEAAMYHSLAAGDYAAAAHLLETPDLIGHARPDQILDWLDRLPPAILDRHPKLAIRRLWVLLEQGELAAVEARLAALGAGIAADAQLELESLVIRIQLANRRREFAAAIALGRRLMSRLPERPTPESRALELGGLFGLGEAYLLAGDLAAALDRFQTAARLSEAAGNAVFHVRARLMVARVLTAQGALSGARATLAAIAAEAADAHPNEAALAREMLAQVEAAAAARPIEPLTLRELDVLRLLDSDLPLAAIGERLFISTNTVKTHLRRIYGKLGARSRFEAVAIARENHLL